MKDPTLFLGSFLSSFVNPWTPKSDLHLNYPYDITPESRIKVMSFRMLLCHWVGWYKADSQFLVEPKQAKKGFFSLLESWGIWILSGWVEEFELESLSLSSKIDMFFLINMEVFNNMKFSNARGSSGGWKGCWNFKLIDALLTLLQFKMMDKHEIDR